MPPPGPTRDELTSAFEAAAEDLRSRDASLGEATERTVVARFMIYLEYHLSRLDNPAGFCLDMEYERNKRDPKALEGCGPDGQFRRKIVPDLVYHQRQQRRQYANHVAIEIKARRTRADAEEHDLAKLAVLTGREPYAFLPTPRRMTRRRPNDPVDPPPDRKVVVLPQDLSPYTFGALLRLYTRDQFIEWV